MLAVAVHRPRSAARRQFRPDYQRSAAARVLCRFAIEHTFWLLKQTSGWTVPVLRDPPAAERWTWVSITVYS